MFREIFHQEPPLTSIFSEIRTRYVILSRPSIETNCLSQSSYLFRLIFRLIILLGSLRIRSSMDCGKAQGIIHRLRRSSLGSGRAHLFLASFKLHNLYLNYVSIANASQMNSSNVFTFLLVRGALSYPLILIFFVWFEFQENYDIM